MQALSNSSGSALEKYRGFRKPRHLHGWLEPEEFERLVAEYLREFGWHATPTSSSGDGGVDVKAERTGLSIRVGVQVKRLSPDRKAGSPVIQKYDSIPEGHRDIQHAAIACSSGFTRDAALEAKKRNVSLVDGKRILRAIEQVCGRED